MHALWQRELDAAVVELLHLRPPARRRLDYLHFDYLEYWNEILKIIKLNKIGLAVSIDVA